jgi:hypothetical protein
LAFEPAGKVAEFTHTDRQSVEEVLNDAFAMFNRGSGAETSFIGPSASVGDIFRVTVDDDTRFAECHMVTPVGFELLPNPYTRPQTA